MSCVLVTGGAGYIGSHTCVELLAAGHDVVVVDNFINSKHAALKRVEALSGRTLAGFYPVDICDRQALRAVFSRHRIDAVMHFAGLKCIAESCEKPLLYYENNVNGTFSLLEAMISAGVFRFVFSSSASVYGASESVPIREDFPIAPVNPYARTKWMVEQILRDIARDERWRVVLLRYFNPVGAHESGLIGEDPDVPNNLMPYVCQVAAGKRPVLRIFGGDYPTVDGTGVRDYIHVVDLARGHVRALERLEVLPPVLCCNLGTGRGYSVLELVHAFEAVSGQPVPYEMAERRAGDVAECWADSALAQRMLGWSAQYDLNAMCVDAWRWQLNNPQGYPAE